MKQMWESIKNIKGIVHIKMKIQNSQEVSSIYRLNEQNLSLQWFYLKLDV